MVVYLDRLFLLNLGVDTLLLSAAARLSRSGGTFRRSLLAGAVGALYAAGIILLPWLGHPLLRLAAAALMVCLCTGFGARTGAALGLFLLLSLSLAGGVLLLTVTGVGGMSSALGIPLSLSDGQLLLLCAAGEYLLCAGVCALTGRSGATASVLLRCQGRTVLLRALVDSGNLLRDPLTGRSVMVVSAKAAAGLFPPQLRPTAEELRCPEKLYQRLAEAWEPGRVRLLPYQAVGTARGLLLGVRLDALEVNGREVLSRLIAVSPNSFTGSCQAIIGLEEGA